MFEYFAQTLFTPSLMNMLHFLNWGEAQVGRSSALYV